MIDFPIKMRIRLRRLMFVVANAAHAKSCVHLVEAYKLVDSQFIAQIAVCGGGGGAANGFVDALLV